MPTFRTFESPSTGDVSYFHSGNYTAPSYSSLWTTRYFPDSEGLNTPVYQLVLDKFNIPYTGGPSCGTLPGIDIKRMNAMEAIRLSLAECLVNGEWWDIYEDGLGGVYFQNIYGNSAKTVNLDVRLCIPSTEKKNQVDMVIVRGYDPAPVREVRDFKTVVLAGTGTINPTDVDGGETLFTVAPSELLSASCHSRLVHNTVHKSYRDPIKTDEYQPQEENPFYDLQAFESLIGYVQRIKGMPDDPREAARVNYEFQDTTPWYFPVSTFPQLQKTSQPGCAGNGVEVSDLITYVEGSFTYNVPEYNDRYGTPWPLVRKPVGLYFTGNKLSTIVDWGGASAPVTAYVAPVKELKSVDGGAGWVWTRPNTRELEISIYFQLQSVDQEILWDAIVASIGKIATIKYSDGSPIDSNKFGTYGSSQGILKVIAGPGDLGYLVDDMWLALELDRPCVTITDNGGGEALEYAQDLEVEAAPIILVDRPAPTVYTTGGEVVVVDQSQGRVDNDPTTTQSLEETDLERMHDLMQGNVLDVTLPFCADEEQCAEVARTLYAYMHNTGVQTFVLTCGPDSEPELGAHVEGYGTGLVIDEIDYSYSDGSSYTINVTLGPIFSNVGSWNNGGWIKQTEDIERPAEIRYVAGDGTNYRVYVKGLGMYNAVNGTDMVFYPGEIVSVRIYNNPVEE